MKTFKKFSIVIDSNFYTMENGGMPYDIERFEESMHNLFSKRGWDWKPKQLLIAGSSRKLENKKDSKCTMYLHPMNITGVTTVDDWEILKAFIQKHRWHFEAFGELVSVSAEDIYDADMEEQVKYLKSIEKELIQEIESMISVKNKRFVRKNYVTSAVLLCKSLPTFQNIGLSGYCEANADYRYVESLVERYHID